MAVGQVVTFDRRILSQTYNGETFLHQRQPRPGRRFLHQWRVKDASYYFQATGVARHRGRRLAENRQRRIKSVVAERTLEQMCRPNARQ